jgi:TPR repeat protein
MRQLGRWMAILVVAGGVLRSGFALADFDSAMQDYRSGNYGAALGVFEELAAKGDVSSQLMIGSMYFYGRGVPHDEAKAASWFGRAAATGDPAALLAYGSLFKEGKGVKADPVEAYMWLTLAADPKNGDVYKTATQIRDGVARGMTPEQIAEAERRAKAWKAPGG